ncbi:hypothetical protein BEN76_16945 (plasmid) [Acinetobacter soli]|uniref:Uncharacterized protein n=1 Tax=Acinetobacter soli TaxID=487316 RepID=A0A1P8END3_9GAMM|nr:hypothetical protein BEN76_16945 [Acinetobacter soli]
MNTAFYFHLGITIFLVFTLLYQHWKLYGSKHNIYKTFTGFCLEQARVEDFLKRYLYSSLFGYLIKLSLYLYAFYSLAQVLIYLDLWHLDTIIFYSLLSLMMFWQITTYLLASIVLSKVHGP